MSKNQKILYVITKSNWGGAQRYVFDLATGLNFSFPPPSATPPSVILSAPEGSHSSKVISQKYNISVALGGDGLLAQKLKNAGIPVITIKNLARDIVLTKDLSVFRELLAIFRHERPDIVHLNSSKIGLLGALAARLAGIKKIIFTAHGWAFNEDRALPMKLFLYFMSALTGLLATDLIVLSDKELSQTKKLPFIFKKTRRIYNGLKTFETLPRDEARKLLPEFIEGLPTLENKLVIGTIAELHPNKGLDYAIRAIANIVKSPPPVILSATEGSQFPSSLRGGLPTKQSLNNLIFIIIGAGEAEPRLRALIKELELEQTVFLAGFLENASQYLPAFDIFTLTSLKEGLPYVILEAGLAGLPIVATNVGALPEIFPSSFLPPLEGEDRGGGSSAVLIPPKNIPALTSALQTLLADPAKRSALGASARARVTENFSYDKMLEETKKIYGSSVIARSDS